MPSRLTVVAAAAALSLGGLYLGAARLGGTGAAAGAADRSFHVSVGDAGDDAGAQALDARQGDRITFSVTSLRAGELYVHGPESERVVVPGVETSLTFTAQYSGRYYVHFHQSGCSPDHALDEVQLEVAVLDVMPR